MIGWQQTLMVTQEVPISCHSIGIRAHDFTTEPQATNQIEVHHLQTLSAPLNKVLGFNTNKPKFGGKAAIDSIRKLLLSYPFHLQQLCHYVYKIEKDYVKRLTYDCIFIYNRFMKGYSCKRNNRYYIGSEGV